MSDGYDDSPDFSDVNSGGSSTDGFDDFESYSSGGGANYGSALGGLQQSLLSGTGGGTSLAPSRSSSRVKRYASGRVAHAAINPLNPKALRRAISRVYRFETFAKRVLKITSPKHHVAGIKRHRRKRTRSW